jgi:hypothetical protein
VTISSQTFLFTIERPISAATDTLKQAIPTVQTVPYNSSALVCISTRGKVLEQQHRLQHIVQHLATVLALLRMLLSLRTALFLIDWRICEAMVVDGLRSNCR